MKWQAYSVLLDGKRIAIEYYDVWDYPKRVRLDLIQNCGYSKDIKVRAIKRPKPTPAQAEQKEQEG